MNEHLYTPRILQKVNEFMELLPPEELARIEEDKEALLEGDFASIRVKTIHGKIRELIVGRYRLLFFIETNIAYFIHIFTKQSKKTPKKEIEYAKKLYNLIKKMKKKYAHKEDGVRVIMINGLKFYYGDDLLKKRLKSPVFRRAFEEARARRRLQRQLREARMAKRMTQKKLAEKVDMTQSVIARIESGERNLSVETLSRIARAVGKELQLA